MKNLCDNTEDVYIKWETKVNKAKELRNKESDRLQVMSETLDAFGVKFQLKGDGITINGLGKTGTFKTAEIDSHD